MKWKTAVGNLFNVEEEEGRVARIGKEPRKNRGHQPAKKQKLIQVHQIDDLIKLTIDFIQFNSS